MKKKLVSLLCVAVLLLSCMSASASSFAAQEVFTEAKIAEVVEQIHAQIIEEHFNIKSGITLKNPTCCSNMNRVLVSTLITCHFPNGYTYCVSEYEYSTYGCTSCGTVLDMTSRNLPGCGRPKP